MLTVRPLKTMLIKRNLTGKSSSIVYLGDRSLWFLLTQFQALGQDGLHFSQLMDDLSSMVLCLDTLVSELQDRRRLSCNTE